MTRSFSVRVFLQGTMIGILSLIAFIIGSLYGENASHAAGQTMTFAVLALAQMTHVFNVRSNTRSAFRGMFSNKMLLGAIGIVLLLMLVVLEFPVLHDIFHLTTLTATQWIWVVMLSVAPLPIVELVKSIVRLVKK